MVADDYIIKQCRSLMYENANKSFSSYKKIKSTSTPNENNKKLDELLAGRPARPAGDQKKSILSEETII